MDEAVRFAGVNDTAAERPDVTLADREGVALLVLDDGKANALSHSMLDQINDCLNRAEDSRALVVAGRPGKFSAGFDLSVVSQGPGPASELMERGAQMALRLHEWHRPRVMAVTGHALAMGAVLLGCADIRIGAIGDFKIGFNEVAIGLPMPEFANELLRGRLSPRHFHQAVALARIHSPTEAVEAGFLDRVADAEEVVEVAVDTAAELADRLDPKALAITRRTLDRDLTARLKGLTSGWADSLD